MLDRLAEVPLVGDVARRCDLVLAGGRRRLQVLLEVVFKLGLQGASVVDDGLFVEFVVMDLIDLGARAGLVHQAQMLLRSACHSTRCRLYRR